MSKILWRYLACCAGMFLAASPAAAQLHPWCPDLVQLEDAASDRPPFSSLGDARLRDLLGFRDCTLADEAISCARPGTLDDPVAGTTMDAIQLCLRGRREPAPDAPVRFVTPAMELRFTAVDAAEGGRVMLRISAAR